MIPRVQVPQAGLSGLRGHHHIRFPDEVKELIAASSFHDNMAATILICLSSWRYCHIPLPLPKLGHRTDSRPRESNP
nr:uncharacterized protein LOC108054391 isoform X4 [Drosophila takahashii]